MLFFLSRKPPAPDFFSSSSGRRVDQEIPRRGEAYIDNLAPLADLSNRAVGSIVRSLYRKYLLIISIKCFEGRLSQPTTRYRLESKGSFSTSVRVDRNCFQKILIVLRVRFSRVCPTRRFGQNPQQLWVEPGGAWPCTQLGCSPSFC